VLAGALVNSLGDLPESGDDARAVAAGIWSSIPAGYFLGWWLDKKTTQIAVVRQ
jgi:hypothetical protein